MSRYYKLAPNAFQKISANAGVLARAFDPATGALNQSDIMGVSSGGFAFNAAYEYKDYGEDIDNCPKNTAELKRISGVTVTVSGTFTAVDAGMAATLAAAADISGNKITPRKNIVSADFRDLWLICDYSDDVSEETGGYLAIHILNALSTGGFQLQTTDDDKGKFAFEFTGHYSYYSPETVPYEIYIQTGTALGSMSVTSVAGTSSGKTKLTVGGYIPSGDESYVYKTAASVTLPDRGDSVASGWTAWNGTDEISATNGQEIAVVVKNSDSEAVAGGKTTVVAAS